MPLRDTEPVTLVGAVKLAVVGVVTAVTIALELDAELTAAVIGAASALAIVVGILLERAMVYSPATYRRDVDEALNTQPPVPPERLANL